MSRKILITGSEGMLGKRIVSTFFDKTQDIIIGIDKNISSTRKLDYHFQGDLTDSTWLKEILKTEKPDVIINTVAIVNLNICESNIKLSEELHVKIPRILAKFCNRIIHISTDSVFNGEKGDYTEKDVPDPLNWYSKTKLLGEFAIMASNMNSLIIRTNIFGYNNPLRNSLAEWSLKSLSNNIEINGYDNVFFNPLYVRDLAETLVFFIDNDTKGILNVGCTDYHSKYNFLNIFAEVFSFNTNLISNSSLNNQNSPINRPLNTTLNITKAKELVKLPSLKEGLLRMKEDWEGKNEQH